MHVGDCAWSTDLEPPEAKARRVRIVVPFYKAPQLVKPLFKSMVECAEEFGRLGCRIRFVNDSPADHDLQCELDACRSELVTLDLTVSMNSENLGFVKTVNAALLDAAKADEDVIVLNSDAVLTKGAVTELMQVAYSDPMIGFVSPRSNNATICTLPHGSEVLDLPPAEAAARHSALLAHLPRVSYVPTAVGFCLYIKSAIIKEFGVFDLAYEEGYNEENDLIMRANRSGYRAALANHAFVWHKGEQSFHSTSAPRSRREEKNSKILNLRYPEYPGLVRNYFNSPEYLAEGLVGALVPDGMGRVSIGFDLSSFGAYHNGTFEAGRRLLFASANHWPPNIRIVVFMERDAWKFHGLDECQRLEWFDTHDPSFRPAALIRIGQPFDEESVRRMVVRAPLIAAFMLDTISADCGYLSTTFNTDVWHFALRWYDVIFTNSKFTADQYCRRYRAGDSTLICPSIHSTTPAEYLPVASRPASNTAMARTRSLLVIGNHFEHKAMIPTVTALAESLPDTMILALGCKGLARSNVKAFESGGLSEEEVDQIYSGVDAVVFPSHYEGFGFPILNALARGKPVYVRRLPPFKEIASRLRSGRENIRWFDDTHDLVRQLSHGVGPWSGPPAKGEELGWRRSAMEVLAAVESRLGGVKADVVADRLRWLRSLRPPASSDEWHDHHWPVEKALQCILPKVAVVLRVMLSNRVVYNVLRWTWRGSRWLWINVRSRLRRR